MLFFIINIITYSHSHSQHFANNDDHIRVYDYITFNYRISTIKSHESYLATYFITDNFIHYLENNHYYNNKTNYSNINIINNTKNVNLTLVNARYCVNYNYNHHYNQTLIIIVLFMLCCFICCYHNPDNNNRALY